MDSEILKDLLVHSDYNNLTCHQHKEIFGNQSHYYSCRPEDPEFYDCHPEILWKDINVSLFVNIHLSSPPKCLQNIYQQSDFSHLAISQRCKKQLKSGWAANK